MKSEKEEFLFASTTVPEVNELDQELFENLNRFAIQLGYLNAAATTGRDLRDTRSISAPPGRACPRVQFKNSKNIA